MKYTCRTAATQYLNIMRKGVTLQDSSTDQLYAQILQFYDEIFNSVRTWIELTLTD